MNRVPENAVAALADLIDHLKDRGVRTFRGDLLAPDGSKLWSVDVSFERQGKPREHADGE